MFHASTTRDAGAQKCRLEREIRRSQNRVLDRWVEPAGIVQNRAGSQDRGAAKAAPAAADDPITTVAPFASAPFLSAPFLSAMASLAP